ncbi:MAG TPA: glutamine synthetase, partial [Candidatus Methanoperedenaceae archaeon]|nr:glutamine synthetase [Candidatus Methanoperedenaceae archaeon]
MNMAATKDDVISAVEENDVKFIWLWFTDIVGVLKGVEITKGELEDALDRGMGFDGASIDGYQDIEESDMVGMPDTSTFQIIPCRPKDTTVTARMFVDVLTPDRKPYEGDPRYVLKRNLERAAKLGLKMFVGPELEYFYFRNSNATEVLDEGGYFDLTPLDLATEYRRETVIALEKMGIPVESSHHEVAPSQHEIDLRYTDALTMADNVMTYRMVVKEIAQNFGVYATFMPKPIFGENGSGMHTHQSLFRGDRNVFFDTDDEYYLSDIAKSYLAGFLRHSREICSVYAQSVNSYKRLVPGFEAPVYIAWARRNRSALIRVPTYQPGKELATRIEYRAADPVCNPYLTFAVMLAAGLEGVEKGYELPDPLERNIYKMTEGERKDLGVETLPANLGEAIAETEKSEVVRRALGEHT